MDMEVLLQSRQSAAADLRVARLLVAAQLVARGLVELRQKVESNVGGLIIGRIGAGNVVAQRAQRGLTGERAWLFSSGPRGGVLPRHQAGGDGLHVPLHAGNLPRKEDLGAGAEMQGGGKQRGRIDKGIAMDLAEAQELGVFEAGDQAQNARLFAEFQMV